MGNPYEEVPPLEVLNTSELMEIIRRHTGVRVRRGLLRERMIQIIKNAETPAQDEVPGSAVSRKRLEVWIEKNWTLVNSQLPCKGPNYGKCTIYPCPEARHLECWLKNQSHIL